MTATQTRVYEVDRLPAIGPAAVCMGVFDGVHRGHCRLVETTVAAATARGIPSVALVFDPHPDEVVRPGTVVPRLAPLAENVRRLVAAGIDRAVPIRFDGALRALSPEAFLEALTPGAVVRALVMTPESAFGRNRAGTPEAMRHHGLQAGFDVVLAEPILDDGKPISSARIRAVLAEGRLEEAERLLGRPVYLEATTDGGDPEVAQLVFGYPPALPSPGRYAATWRNGGRSAAGTIEIAPRGAVSLTTVPLPRPGEQLVLELRAAGGPASAEAYANRTDGG